jgi:phenylpyruvate tautomerase PptA (4-oxalocrotonate tautomerase family)
VYRVSLLSGLAGNRGAGCIHTVLQTSDNIIKIVMNMVDDGEWVLSNRQPSFRSAVYRVSLLSGLAGNRGAGCIHTVLQTSDNIIKIVMNMVDDGEWVLSNS